MCGMNLYDATVPIFQKMLGNVESWLDEAEKFAAERSFKTEALLESRLAPNQWALTRQIQTLCDTAKLSCARMTGKEAPSNPDTEKTLEEIRARITSCKEYIGSFKPADFVDCESRQCAAHWMKPKGMKAGVYLDHFALPNFYFHYTTAYTILRHNGVQLGKMDFLGTLPLEE